MISLPSGGRFVDEHVAGRSTVSRPPIRSVNSGTVMEAASMLCPTPVTRLVPATPDRFRNAAKSLAKRGHKWVPDRAGIEVQRDATVAEARLGDGHRPVETQVRVATLRPRRPHADLERPARGPAKRLQREEHRESEHTSFLRRQVDEWLLIVADNEERDMPESRVSDFSSSTTPCARRSFRR